MEKEYKKYLEDLKVLGEDEILYVTIDGYLCEIKRQFQQYLCGYINVPIKRDIVVDPQREEDYYEKIFCDYKVHGGITSFTEFGSHVKIGFDCAHNCDYKPLAIYNTQYATYKNVDFVKNELKKLIKQIKGE